MTARTSQPIPCRCCRPSRPLRQPDPASADCRCRRDARSPPEWVRLHLPAPMACGMQAASKTRRQTARVTPALWRLVSLRQTRFEPISPARIPSPPVSPGFAASSALLGATRSSTDASARSVPSSRLLTHRIAPGPAMRRQSDQAMPNQSVAISRPTPWTHRNTTMRTPRDSRFMGTRATNRHDVDKETTSREMPLRSPTARNDNALSQGRYAPTHEDDIHPAMKAKKL